MGPCFTKPYPGSLGTTDMADPFGRAIHDHQQNDQDVALVQRDGSDTIDHPIEELYFEPVDLEDPGSQWLADQCAGPLLDVGAGAGRHVLAFQERFEAVGIEVSEHLVDTMQDRGVEDARQGSLFELSSVFSPDRFESVILIGTQSNLVGSRAGLRSLLVDLDTITTADGTIVLDSYDPTMSGTDELLGYRSDETPGLAFRVLHFEYEDDVGPTLLFRLFSPDVVRNVARDTPWEPVDISRPTDRAYYYRIALRKSRGRVRDST